MEIKILQVFYDKNGLPYKDKERTVHYPITSGTFLGASNTTQIRFYYDQLDELNESTFVAVSKLPNGKIGSEILESEYDSELQENYAILNLSQFYTQYKGDVFISLQGYQGGVRVEQDENGIYQIYGTPTIQATGSIKMYVAYAPTFVGSGQTENITLQRVLAELATKLGIRQETLHVEELPTVGNPNVWYVVNDDTNDPNKANIYIWNAKTQSYVWVGDNTLNLGDYYTKEEGETFEQGIENRVQNVEDEASSVASGSPAGVYATASDLLNAYPNGDNHIYLVLSDGNWYYWDTTTTEWTAGGLYLSDAPYDELKTSIELCNAAIDELNQDIYGQSRVQLVKNQIKYPFVIKNNDVITFANKSGQNFSQNNAIRFYDADGNLVGGSLSLETTYNSRTYTFTNLVSDINFVEMYYNRGDIIIVSKETQGINILSKTLNNENVANRNKEIIYYGENDPIDMNFEQGSIQFYGDSSGVLYDSDSYIRSGTSLPQGKYVIKGNGLQIGICLYNSNTIFNHSTFDSVLSGSWLGELNFTVPENKFAKIILRKNTSLPTLTPEENTSVVKEDIYILNELKKTNSAILDGYYASISKTTEFVSRMGIVDNNNEADTLLGIKKARKYGYEHIRLNLSFTLDSVPVLAHDETITIDGNTYVIAETNYSVLEGHLASLDDAILLCARLGMRVDLELKYGISNSNLLIAWNIVAKRRMTHATLWTTQTSSYLQYIQTLQPTAMLGLIAHLSISAINTAYSLKTNENYVRIDCFNTNYNPEYTDDYSDAVLQYASSKGIKIKMGSTWTLEDFLSWVGKVDIVEVALFRYPYKVVLDNYLEIE